MSFGNVMHCLDGIAKVKIEQFAEEANQLTADEINEYSEAKRYTLIASLIYRSQAKAKDAIAVMFCRLIAIVHKQSRHYTNRGIRKILMRYTKLAGIERFISPHKLRHFLFTWLKKKNITDAFISDLIF